nr:transport and Golgi organization protein 1-like isoform X1 [Procambarus clarkii]
MGWRLVFVLLAAAALLPALQAHISDLRLCADTYCKEPVSKGITVLNYNSNDEKILSFANGVEVTVYSKEAGSREDLWGVEIKGKRGYVPKQYVRENKLFIKDLKYKVPTEAFIDNKNTWDNDDKYSIDNEDSSKTNELTQNDANEDKVLRLEEIAISAEDVEYNRLKVKTEDEQPHHAEREGPTYEDKESTDESQELPKHSQGDETGSEDVDEHESKEEGVEDVKREDTKEELNDLISDSDEENNDGKKEKEEENVEQFDTAGENESITEMLEKNGSLLDLVAADDTTELNESTKNGFDVDDAKSVDSVDSSPVNYEVIDGTTVYLDDVTVTVSTPVESSSTVLEASSGVAENLVSAHPHPSLSLTTFETAQPQVVNTKPTVAPSLEDIASVAPDVISSTYIVENSEQITPILPFEKAPIVLENIANSDISPSSSWLFNVATTVSSWVNAEDKTAIEESKEEDSDDKEDINTDSEEKGSKSNYSQENVESINEGSTDASPTINTNAGDSIGATDEIPIPEEIGGPKPSSGVEASDIQAVAESEGFFSSLFGSSEKTHNLEVEESTSGTDSPEALLVLKEAEEVEANNVSEDGRREGSETDPTDSSTIAAIDNVPIDDTEIPENVVQTPYHKEEEYNTFTTRENVPSSAGDDPHSSVSSTLEEPPQISLETDDQPPVGDGVHDSGEGAIGEEDTHVDIDTEEPRVATISEVEDPTDLSPSSEDEEDPGPSTARPMYAEPQPSSQDYPVESHGDSSDVVHLTGGDKVCTADHSEGVDIVQDEGSLSEEFLRASHSLLPEGLAFGVEAEVADPHMSAGAIVFLFIVVFTIITIYFVHLIMVKASREAPMLRALNHVEHQNRLMAEENTSLHEQLCKARAELEAVSSSVMGSVDDIIEPDSRLELIKSEYDKEKAQQEERILQLEHELEEATSNGLEMHKMLSEMLSAQRDTSAFQASVDELQAMLDGQQEKVETLTSNLALKTRLNEELQNELSLSLERTNKLDYQVQQLTQSLQELTTTKEETNNRFERETMLVKELTEANYSLSQQANEYDSKISSLSSELEELKDTISQLRESVETKESELQVSKECFKQLRLTSDDDLAAPDEEKLSALFDVVRVKAELQRVNRERNELGEQLQEAKTAQTNLEETVLSLRSEVAELRAHHDLAIQEKQEALSKLAVLSQYFGEKEAHLTKELESQEGLRLNAEGSAAAISKKIQNYEFELASYKAQVESIRKELEDQENSYKVQIASHEQKAHENWLQARAAERKHEEQRQENSQLRSRLTLLQKEKEEAQQLHISIIKPTPKRVDANGSMSSPGPIMDGVVDVNHSGVSSMLRDVDSPPVPPHPMHGPPHPMLSMMFPPGGPLPPGVPPPHGLPPGIPPPPGLPPHGLPPHGLPPHGLPPHGLPPPPPFLSGEPPFIGPLHPLPGDRRLPPAGGMSSPPFRRSGSPSYDHRNDRYSPGSDRSHFSDRRYSPPPLRNRPPSPESHRNRSPDRRSDRTRSPDRRSDRMRSPDRRFNRHTPEHRLDGHSPDRHFSTRSPDGYMRHRTSPHYFHQSDYNSDDPRLRSTHIKGSKQFSKLQKFWQCVEQDDPMTIPSPK